MDKIREEDIEKELENSFGVFNFSVQEKEFIKVVEKYKSKNEIAYLGVVEIFRLAKEFLKIRK